MSANQMVDDWFQGYQDCEDGKPPQKDTEYYQSGFAAAYHQAEADAFRSEQAQRVRKNGSG